MNRIQAVCAVNVGVAVALGAIGTHALRGRIAENLLETHKTGQNYHLAMALAALLFALAPRKALHNAALSLLVGTVLFSGSLYAYALTARLPFVMITPLGGLVWIVTWMVVGFHLWNNPLRLGTESTEKG